MAVPLLALAAVTGGGTAQAKDVTGFLIGNSGSDLLAPGLYTYDLAGETSPQLVKGIAYSPFGGAYGNRQYWIYLSMDTQGLMMDGFWCLDPSDGSLQKRTPCDYGFTDLTFDYSTEEMYGVLSVREGSAQPHQLVRIELPSGNYTTIGRLSDNIVALACDLWGDLLGISSAGTLYRIDRDNGDLTRIGDTGIVPSEKQPCSMDFDRDSSELYWCVLDSNDDAWMVRLDPLTGAVEEKKPMQLNSLMTGLYIPFDDHNYDAPNSVTFLEHESVPEGEKFTWTNPIYSISGTPFSEEVSLEIRRNGRIVHTENNITPGEEMSWTDTEQLADGKYSYAFTCYSSLGRGAVSYFGLVHGEDIPSPVTGLKVTADGDKATLTWDAPETGKNGGSIIPENLRYRIVRNPGMVTYSDIRETTFTETIAEAGNYTWSVTAYNGIGESDPATAGPVMAGNPLETPFAPNFANEADFARFTIISNDENKWYVKDSELWFGTIYGAGDDWAITPPLHLQKGVTYRASFTMGTGISGFNSTENFRLTLGTGTTADTQPTTLLDKPGFDETSENFTQEFTVPETGTYTLGFYTWSNSDNADGWVLRLSNLIVQASGPCDLTATAFTGDASLAVGTEAVHTLTVKNNGSETCSAFTAQIRDTEGNVLASAPYTEPLEPGASADVKISWNPSDSRVTALRGYAAADGDVNPGDNVSRPFDVTFVNPGEVLVTAGTHDSDPGVAPFCMDYLYSYAESIYTAEEIGVPGGMIKSLTWYYDNPHGTLSPKHIRVYLANTDMAPELKGYADTSEMMQVYEGDVTFADGAGTLKITLDEPFPYAGRNLMIVTTKERDSDAGKRVTFHAQNYPEIPRSAVASGNSGNVSAANVQYSSMLPNLTLHLATSGGHRLSGTVSCGDESSAGTVVSLDGKATSVTAGENGSYAFPWLPDGTYGMTVTPLTYRRLPATATVNIEGADRENFDITLPERPSVPVSGQVTAADGTPVADAAVILSGWEKMTASSDADGSFRFDKVYTRDGNVLTAYAAGYDTASASFDIPESGDVTTPSLALAPVHNPVYSVTAWTDNSGARLIWDAADYATDIIADNGTPASALTIPTADAIYGLGKKFDAPARVYEISWYTPSTQTAPVNLLLFPLDEEGKTGEPEFLENEIEVKPGEWQSLRLDEAVDAPYGCVVALTSAENISVACDGTVREGSVLVDTDSGIYEMMEDQNGPVNVMIRLRAAYFNPAVGSSEPEATYAVYRIPENGEESDLGTVGDIHFADAAWLQLAPANYRYGVEAIYPDGTRTARTLSNMLTREDSGVAMTTADGLRIEVRSGELILTASRPTPAVLTTASGLTVMSRTLPEGTVSVAVAPGVYMLNTPAGVQKLLIP